MKLSHSGIKILLNLIVYDFHDAFMKFRPLLFLFLLTGSSSASAFFEIPFCPLGGPPGWFNRMTTDNNQYRYLPSWYPPLYPQAYPYASLHQPQAWYPDNPVNRYRQAVPRGYSNFRQQ